MKKYLFYLMAFLMLPFLSISQTKIADKQEISGKWKKSKSPYIIEGEAIIPEGKTLKIKPGTVILFKTGGNINYYDYNTTKAEYELTDNFDVGMLRVNGTLVAKGKKGNEIMFSRDGAVGHWGTIFFNSKSEENLMDYCIVEYANYVNYILESGTSAEGSVAFYNSKGTISNSIVRENTSSAGIISTYDSQITINGNLVDNCFYGISFGHGAFPTVENNICANNYLGIRAYYCKPNVVKNITFVNNRKASVKLQTQELLVLNSVFADEETGAQYGEENKLKISYSAVQIKTLEGFIEYMGGNIFGEKASFVNLEKKDFNLLPDSKWNGKGENGVNIGARLNLNLK